MSTILILHGWGSCAKNWARIRELLEKDGKKVFIPDLPGFGENYLLSKPWSSDDYVNWVRDFCQKNKLSQFFLLGHSFGGSLAVKYALKFPGEIKKIILIDPALIRTKSAKKNILAGAAKIVKIFSFLPFYSLIRRAFYRFVIKSDYPATAGQLRETYLQVIKVDSLDFLSGLSVPTALIWGEKDDVTPLKDAYPIKEKISGAELEILPGIGHDPHAEAPELLVKKILANL